VFILTKSEVKAALDKAIREYNEEMEGYIIHCDDDVKPDMRKIVSATMDCFADFEDVISKLAD